MIDERIAAALEAEADLAEADADVWPTIERRVARARRRRRTGFVAVAAVACIVAGVLVVQSPLGDDGDGGGQVDTIDEPEPTSTPTPNPDLPADPVGDQPGPAPRQDAPPETIVALTTDSRVVVVDTATGEEIRQLASAADTHADWPTMLGPDSIGRVALSPDGQDVWYDTCCAEGGRIYRVPVDGSAPPEWVGSGYDPTFSSGMPWNATVSGDELDLNWPTGDWGRYWLDEDGAANPLQEAAWSLDGSVVVARGSAETIEGDYVEAGPLLVLDPSSMGYIEGSDAVDYDHQTAREIGGLFKLPTFRRDGLLTVAVQEAGGRWVRETIDLERGLPDTPNAAFPVETDEYGGEPFAQDYDPSGEWLVAVVQEPGAVNDGVLRWYGPDGESGELGSGYFAATW